MSNGLIPKSVLGALADGPWKHSDYEATKFDNLLLKHESQDDRAGCTCTYNMKNYSESLSFDEFMKMVDDGVIPDFLRDGQSVNQHWLHSIEQFFAQCTIAWNQHVERTDALKGTASGKLVP